jgi:hypothetical protein
MECWKKIRKSRLRSRDEVVLAVYRRVAAVLYTCPSPNHCKCHWGGSCYFQLKCISSSSAVFGVGKYVA